MNDYLILVPVFAAGVVLGLLYFGGLWLTVNRLAATQYPARLALLSFLFRLLLLVAAFYWLMGDQIERLLVGMVGFWLARLTLMKRLSPIKSQFKPEA